VGPKCVILPNVIKSGQTVAEMYGDLTVLVAVVRHLRFVEHVFGSSTKTTLLGGLCRCAKCGWNRCSSFDNYECFNIWRVWLENAFYAPKLFVWGDLTPLMKININEIQKGTNGCENTWFEPLSVKIAAKLTCIPTEETDRAAK